MMNVGAESLQQVQAREAGRSPAQWYCLVFGALLLLLAIAGFFVNASFDGIEGVAQGDKILAWEVNGWHNVVHLASGLLLLVTAAKAAMAKSAALAFGAVYLVVAVWGFVGGEDILFVAVNTFDDWFHLVLGLLGVIAGLVSPTHRTAAA
jgi:hypothetical protein